MRVKFNTRIHLMGDLSFNRARGVETLTGV